jgi:hypothetical protein
MTRVNTPFAAPASQVDGAVVGILSTIALVLAGFLSLAMFAAV